MSIHVPRKSHPSRATESHRRPGVGVFLLCLACLFGTGNFSLALAAQDAGPEELIQSAVAARSRGNIQLSLDLLSKAWETADSERLRTRIAAELGASLLQARRLDDAEKLLQQAYAGSAGAGRAKVAVDLGNLAFSRGNGDLARRYFEEAEALAGKDLRARLPASLNRARLLPAPERFAALAALFGEIAGIGEPAPRARLYLNLGFQARQLAPQGLELAYRSFAEVQKLLPQVDQRLALETLDALAQLYEDQGRWQEALRLTQSALARAGAAGASGDEDILLRLEWRKGRFAQRDGRRRDALVAYQNAAHHLEAIRQDLPIEYEDGRSSYRDTLQPVLNGLVDLLLADLNDLPERERAASLRSAINALELTRQSEMQDFLGDRCAVDGVRSDTPGTIPARTAIIYPVLLPDRLELLLEADGVIVRRTAGVGGAQVAQRAKAFARALARLGSNSYLPAAREIYDWVLRPFEDEFSRRDIRNIVVVSDGPLRLIPFGALHDGKRFAIERFAFSTVTGMSMTSTQAPVRKQSTTLLAGMAEPGPVVDKLAAADTKAMLAAAGDAGQAPAQRGAPLIRSARVRALQSPDSSTNPAQRAAWLRESLSLPGVKQEIQELEAVMPNTSLVDQNFTLERFTKEISSGDYRIVHIASHGVFGGSASSSYIMTYDQVLTMDRLESLLKGKQAGTAPIELLTLSACETAEGNERAPLGISGAAIKAKAQSVIGTLWPVGDEAARKLMGKFYEGLVKENYSKAEALQRAQKEMLAKDALSHPFYWAPFALIGNWM